MSLIFKALKKIKEQPAAHHQDQSAKKERYVYSFRKLVFSPLLFAVSVLMLVVVGIGLFYATNHINQQALKAPLPVKIAPRQIVQPPDPSHHAAEGTYLAKAVPSESAAVDDGPLKPEEAGAQAAPETERSGLQPPAAQSGSSTREGDAPASQEENVQSPEANSRFLPRNKLPEPAATSASLNQLAPRQASPTPRNAKTDFMKKDRFAPDRSPRAAQAHDKRKHQTVLRNKADQQAHVVQLVRRIEAAMNRHDDQAARQLINALAALKGHENIYVLKLKAYWHLRRDEFDAAVVLLNKVLKKDAEDLEAGINLAVVEMKTSQFAAAQKRLAKLHEVYPDNNLVFEMLHKLR